MEITQTQTFQQKHTFRKGKCFCRLVFTIIHVIFNPIKSEMLMLILIAKIKILQQSNMLYWSYWCSLIVSWYPRIFHLFAGMSPGTYLTTLQFYLDANIPVLFLSYVVLILILMVFIMLYCYPCFLYLFAGLSPRTYHSKL